MVNTQIEIRAWVADLAAYNNGSLEGFWMDCTSDPDDMQESIETFLHMQSKMHGELREEYAIHDWDNEIGNWGEYPDWKEVAQVVELLEGDIDQRFISLALSAGIELDEIEDRIVGIYDSVEDFGYQQLEGSELSQALTDFGGWSYFSAEDYGRDCLHCYHYEESGEGSEIVVITA